MRSDKELSNERKYNILSDYFMLCLTRVHLIDFDQLKKLISWIDGYAINDVGRIHPMEALPKGAIRILMPKFIESGLYRLYADSNSEFKKLYLEYLGVQFIK